LKKVKLFGIGMLALAATITLAACGSSNSSSKADYPVALVTDTGGVDDKSFNQSAWEGLKKWGKANGYTKDHGITYFQSTTDQDFEPNISTAVQGGYKLVISVGFSTKQALAKEAKSNPDVNFLMVDDVISNQKNVASATFADNEAAFLAGAAAATQTKTDKIGFVGGLKGDVIERFEAGYVAGAKSVKPNIKVDVQYANSFSDASKGTAIAQAMYGSGIDVIYQVAGNVGTGVFSEAKKQNASKDEADKVWVIGVDRDQKAEGDYTDKNGKKANCTLVSTVKAVGVCVQDIATKGKDGKFPGGKHLTYGLSNGGVSVSIDSANDKVKAAVEKAKADVLANPKIAPEKP